MPPKRKTDEEGRGEPAKMQAEAPGIPNASFMNNGMEFPSVYAKVIPFQQIRPEYHEFLPGGDENEVYEIYNAPGGTEVMLPRTPTGYFIVADPASEVYTTAQLSMNPTRPLFPYETPETKWGLFYSVITLDNKLTKKAVDLWKKGQEEIAKKVGLPEAVQRNEKALTDLEELREKLRVAEAEAQHSTNLVNKAAGAFASEVYAGEEKEMAMTPAESMSLQSQATQLTPYQSQESSQQQEEEAPTQKGRPVGPSDVVSTVTTTTSSAEPSTDVTVPTTGEETATSTTATVAEPPPAQPEEGEGKKKTRGRKKGGKGRKTTYRRKH